MLESKISQKMTYHAKKCLKEAWNLALAENVPEIRPEHLLFAIFQEEGSLGNTILKNLKKTDGSSDELKLFAKKKRDARNEKTKDIELSAELKKIITRAYSLASSFNYPYVGTEHFVYALIESDNEKVQTILGKIKKQSDQNIDKIISSAMNNDFFPNLSKIFDLPEITLSKNKKNGKVPTPYLDQFCVNLNNYVDRKEEIIIGREKEIQRIINILGRKNKNNPILIGDPGVGKTALISKLAQKINSGEVPSDLGEKRILSLDMALVVAGTSFRGEFEARIKEIIREATENKNIILFIDEIHNVIGAGNLSGGLDAANILKPALSRGDIQCIGATTLSEYKKHFEKDPALERRFQPLKVNEPTPEETAEIIRGIRESYEKFHQVLISDEAINQAINLSVRYINNRFLPDKAIDLIDETASAIRNKEKALEIIKEIKILEKEREEITNQKNDLVNLEKYDEALNLRQKEKLLSQKIDTLREKELMKKKQKIKTILAPHITETISQITGIPSEKLSIKKNGFKIKNLQKNLNSQIIGQKNALDKIADILMRSSSGIANPDRPLGSFLFLGPTGVGKTLTAKVLAQNFFGSHQNLIRIDMSEFMERHNVSRLIGAPAGYIGYEEGGRLTEKIKHQPYSIVLFDEIEKAHPDIFNILLQILEDGILTDAEGKEINFKNTVIILTSNLGTSEFTSEARIGFDSRGEKMKIKFEEIKNRVTEELKRKIKPEIINRLDHVIVFNPLDKKEIEKISRLELEKFKKRLAVQGIIFSYSLKIIKFIAQKSLAFDQGARLIRRNIQELVENKVARMIVEGKVRKNKIKLNIIKDKIITTF